MHQVLKLLHIPTEDPWILGVIKAGIVATIVIILLIASDRLMRPLFNKLAEMVHEKLDTQIFQKSRTLFRKLVVVVGTEMAITSLPLPRETEIFIQSAAFIIIAFLLLIALFEVAEVLGLLVKRKAPEFEILSSRILKILFATLVLMVTMQHFEYSIMHILTALGVGTLAVGLAAQPTLTNMIAGFTILIDRPFRRGDRIALSPTEVGDVVNIGIRSTHILKTDGNVLVVANSDLVTSRLVNFNFPNEFVSQTLKFYLSHGSNFQEIKNILKGIAETTPGIVKGSAIALLSGITEWGTEISVTFNIEHFTLGAKATDALIDTAILEFQKRGIFIATNPFVPRP